MMRISNQIRRNTGEPLLPMIDVVFFLVVFFMLTSRLSEPEPFAVMPPLAETEAAEGDLALYLDASGSFATKMVVQTDADALADLAAERAGLCAKTDCEATPPILLLHADALAPANRVAHLLAQLGGLGFSDVRLVTSKP